MFFCFVYEQAMELVGSKAGARLSKSTPPSLHKPQLIKHKKNKAQKQTCQKYRKQTLEYASKHCRTSWQAQNCSGEKCNKNTSISSFLYTEAKRLSLVCDATACNLHRSNNTRSSVETHGPVCPQPTTHRTSQNNKRERKTCQISEKTFG